jgi:hypothetical protein
LIVSDHTPEIGAINRGRGKSLENNAMVLSLQQHFPKSTFKALHLPGFIMPADPISRGEELKHDSLQMQVLERIVKEVKTGRTAFHAFSVRPLFRDNFLTCLDKSNTLPKDEQLKCVLEFVNQDVSGQ